MPTLPAQPAPATVQRDAPPRPLFAPAGSPIFPLRLRFLFGVAVVCATQLVSAHNDLFDLSLDELLDIEVVSVSGRAESAGDLAAAVFVITAEDIRRSGVVSIPEALRLAPGVEAAQIDGNKWAISIRGYNLRFSNKLLVLIDGRPIYTPVFSGVFWDVQDTVLQDIDRIEVIRGPGATLWGANAVNGVINIITRSAEDTQGGLIGALAGNQESGTLTARWGGELGASGAYRVYAKHFERDSNRLASGLDSTDESDQTRLGFRADLSPSTRDSVMITGEIYDGTSYEKAWNVGIAPPFRTLADRQQDVDGYHFLTRWNRQLSETDSFTFQAFVDHADRKWAIANIDKNTADLYVDYATSRFEGHNIILGGGYRFYEDTISPGVGERARARPPRREEEVFSFFAQDEIELVPDRWLLTVGSKFEYNDFVGTQIQPSVRLLWKQTPRATWWASVSRPVRTPGRSDRDYELLYDVVAPPGPGLPPVAAIATGNKDFESELLVAYEAGAKLRPLPNLSLDISAYFNDYDRLRSARILPPICLPSEAPVPDCFAQPPVFAIGTVAEQINGSEADTLGLEISADWRPSDDWRVQTNYSYFNGEEENEGQGFVTSGDTLVTTPTHQASLRVGYKPSSNWELDVWMRYVDELSAFTGEPIHDYTTADLRVAWLPNSRFDLSLVAKNVFDDAQAQFLSEPVDVPLTEIRRSVFLQLNVRF
ncbi:MAG: TonB-dependent receptor [Pseudomonadota bacterium]